MSIRIRGSCLPQTGVALHLALHAIGNPRISRNFSQAAAGDHLPPVYDLDVRAGLYPRDRLNRLGVTLVDRGPRARLNINLSNEADVEPEAIPGTLIAIAPVIGTARIVSAASSIVSALELNDELAEEGD
jgi:hypothetical protein